MKHSKGVPNCLSNKERFGSRMSWGKNLEAFGKSLQRSDFEEGTGKRKVKSLSHVRLFATQWPVAYQASPSMGFSRQESWSGLPFPSPGDLPDPGIEPGSATLEADALSSGAPREALGEC